MEKQRRIFITTDRRDNIPASPPRISASSGGDDYRFHSLPPKPPVAESASAGWDSGSGDAFPRIHDPAVSTSARVPSRVSFYLPLEDVGPTHAPIAALPQPPRSFPTCEGNTSSVHCNSSGRLSCRLRAEMPSAPIPPDPLYPSNHQGSPSRNGNYDAESPPQDRST